MELDQWRFAEKFINDILFEGECGNLSRNSVQINVTSSQSWGSQSFSDVQSPIQRVGLQDININLPASPQTEEELTNSTHSETDTEVATAAKFIENFYAL